MIPTPSLLDTRTAADHLADAEHFESWADRVSGNEGLSAAFRRLALDAYTRARGSDAGDGPGTAPAAG